MISNDTLESLITSLLRCLSGTESFPFTQASFHPPPRGLLSNLFLISVTPLPSFSSHFLSYLPSLPRLQRVVTAKDALVKDLKVKVEAFQERENKAQAAAAAKLAKENAKSKDSWKNEKDKDTSDVKNDSKGEKSPKSVPPFGGGPSRSVTPLRSPLSSSAYTTSGTTSGVREKHKDKEKEGKREKEDPHGFDKENAENEVISVSAHLSASELRAR
jgi:hypothetical protein